MKIIDSFIFFNELEILFYRLSILNDLVDNFILVESTHTFSGNPKELFYLNNKKLFEKFNNKIIHVIINDFPFKYPNINFNYNQQWQNEYHQRNSIINGLQQIKLNNEDIILTSDVDEIPNPELIKKIKENNQLFDKNNLNKLALDMYYYNLNYKVGEGQNWHGIKLLTFETFNCLKLSFQDMRLWEHKNYVPAIPYGGWHLSYFGDIDFIINKIKSYSHQEYNNNNYIDKEILKKKIENGINFIGGCDLNFIKLKDNNNLPPKYEIYLSKFYN